MGRKRRYSNSGTMSRHNCHIVRTTRAPKRAMLGEWRKPTSCGFSLDTPMSRRSDSIRIVNR